MVDGTRKGWIIPRLSPRRCLWFPDRSCCSLPASGGSSGPHPVSVLHAGHRRSWPADRWPVSVEGRSGPAGSALFNVHTGAYEYRGVRPAKVVETKLRQADCLARRAPNPLTEAAVLEGTTIGTDKHVGVRVGGGDTSPGALSPRSLLSYADGSDPVDLLFAHGDLCFCPRRRSPSSSPTSRARRSCCSASGTTFTSLSSPSTTQSFASCLVAHDGKEVSTQGDGFFAVFTSPSACVSAAVELQRALSSHRVARRCAGPRADGHPLGRGRRDDDWSRRPRGSSRRSGGGRRSRWSDPLFGSHRRAAARHAPFWRVPPRSRSSPPEGSRPPRADLST